MKSVKDVVVAMVANKTKGSINKYGVLGEFTAIILETNVRENIG
jgi:hypothetical protein